MMTWLVRRSCTWTTSFRIARLVRKRRSRSCNLRYSRRSISRTTSINFSDYYTPSIFFESGSNFSEKSVGDSVPSQISSLLLQLRQQFSRSSLPLETRKSSALLESYQEKPIFARLEDEEHEESYKRLRREKANVFARLP